MPHRWLACRDDSHPIAEFVWVLVHCLERGGSARPMRDKRYATVAHLPVLLAILHSGAQFGQLCITASAV